MPEERVIYHSKHEYDRPGHGSVDTVLLVFGYFCPGLSNGIHLDSRHYYRTLGAGLIAFLVQWDV